MSSGKGSFLKGLDSASWTAALRLLQRGKAIAMTVLEESGQNLGHWVGFGGAKGRPLPQVK